MKKTLWILKLLLYVFALQILSNVPVHASQKVYVSGEPVGIYIRTNGLLVLGTQEIEDAESERNPSYHKLEAGDYIQKANGKPIRSKKALQEFLEKNRDKEVIFTILRKGEQQDIRITPVYSSSSGSWQIGAWVRSDTQGIGTVTCFRQDGSFAALGHGINDYDLGTSMDIAAGSLYKADISSVMKGKAEQPGEIIGTIDYVPGNYLGSILHNSKQGIVGKLNDISLLCSDKELYPVASLSEVKKGKALLRTSISGKSKDYTIEIEKINQNKKDKQKTLKIHVTDPELLTMTGGIVQGLSGSPILQDGKLIGAVTHVLVSDPARGYGILAEDMLESVKD